MNNLDAPRKITQKIFDAIESDIRNCISSIKVIALLGSAGCGKSTILKRLGLMLAQNGRNVFLSYSEYVPDYYCIADTINSFNQQVILIFDNADLMLSQLPKIIEQLKVCAIPPIIILASRTNSYDLIIGKIGQIDCIHEFKIPNIDRDEIIEIIQKLESFNLLGHLKGMSKSGRINEFLIRSKSQILVAMKEATKGASFDEIIKSEYETITPHEAKFLTACIALTTEAGFTISRQDFVDFSDTSPSETLYFLERNLSDVIIHAGPRQDRLLLRHRVIADYIIGLLDTETLKRVYLRILSSLAPEINVYDFTSRKFALYREIINHYKVYNRFKHNIDIARELYESLIPYFNTDYQFWLQYGSLELEGKGGSLELAENYLLQSQSLKPHSIYVNNTLANLYYKKSLDSNNSATNIGYRNKANEIMNPLLSNVKNEDFYTYSIYGKGNYDYIIKNIQDPSNRKKELENLLNTMKIGLQKHNSNVTLKYLHDVVYQAYLLNAIDGDLTFPQAQI